MLTVELRVNGTLVGHVYGRNKCKQNAQGETEYSYEYYAPESRQVTKGAVWHSREAGIRPLVVKILQDAVARTPTRKKK